jgi:hypothetical protein
VTAFIGRPTWADEEDAWQVMTGLAQRLIDLGEKEFGKPAIPHPRGPFNTRITFPPETSAGTWRTPDGKPLKVVVPLSN